VGHVTAGLVAPSPQLRHACSPGGLDGGADVVGVLGAQAEALDILRPKLRSGRAIANRNTLTYVLINLRALTRLRAAALEEQQSPIALALAA